MRIKKIQAGNVQERKRSSKNIFCYFIFTRQQFILFKTCYQSVCNENVTYYCRSSTFEGYKFGDLIKKQHLIRQIGQGLPSDKTTVPVWADIKLTTLKVSN